MRTLRAELFALVFDGPAMPRLGCEFPGECLVADVHERAECYTLGQLQVACAVLRELGIVPTHTEGLVPAPEEETP